MEVLPVSLPTKCLETAKSKLNLSNTKINFAKKSLIIAAQNITELLKFYKMTSWNSKKAITSWEERFFLKTKLGKNSKKSKYKRIKQLMTCKKYKSLHFPTSSLFSKRKVTLTNEVPWFNYSIFIVTQFLMEGISTIISLILCYNLKVTKQLCPETIILPRLIPTSLTINNT